MLPEWALWLSIALPATALLISVLVGVARVIIGRIDRLDKRLTLEIESATKQLKSHANQHLKVTVTLAKSLLARNLLPTEEMQLLKWACITVPRAPNYLFSYRLSRTGFCSRPRPPGR